jgi:hypothetical protein
LLCNYKLYLANIRGENIERNLKFISTD